MDETDIQEQTSPEPVEPQETPRRRPSLLRRVLVGIAITVVALVLFAVALFNFGGMSGSVYDPGIRDEYRQLVDAGQTQPIQKRFVIGIPGCQCHSTDPVLTEQHRNRRIRECSGCHSR